MKSLGWTEVLVALKGHRIKEINDPFKLDGHGALLNVKSKFESTNYLLHWIQSFQFQYELN